MKALAIMIAMVALNTTATRDSTIVTSFDNLVQHPLSNIDVLAAAGKDKGERTQV